MSKDISKDLKQWSKSPSTREHLERAQLLAKPGYTSYLPTPPEVSWGKSSEDFRTRARIIYPILTSVLTFPLASISTKLLLGRGRPANVSALGATALLSLYSSVVSANKAADSVISEKLFEIEESSLALTTWVKMYESNPQNPLLRDFPQIENSHASLIQTRKLKVKGESGVREAAYFNYKHPDWVPNYPTTFPTKAQSRNYPRESGILLQLYHGIKFFLWDGYVYPSKLRKSLE
eukprot:TRINITY_DN10278_c0_g1_i1.p1 TRINITY_DN10278_c0_g1~~TRINITY_DN10278_c0_g1_i1.p1  ORF type:complete len:254 (-),score=48.82 TRINITY_DN10278_c0_g1_i1:60-764(-)